MIQGLRGGVGYRYSSAKDDASKVNTPVGLGKEKSLLVQVQEFMASYLDWRCRGGYARLGVVLNIIVGVVENGLWNS